MVCRLTNPLPPHGPPQVDYLPAEVMERCRADGVPWPHWLENEVQRRGAAGLARLRPLLQEALIPRGVEVLISRQVRGQTCVFCVCCWF